MQKHEKKPSQKEVTPPQKEVCEKIEYHSTLDMVALRNRLRNNSNEFMRKLELGRGIKEIITEDKIMKASLTAEDREGLELFVKHGQDKDVEPVEWRDDGAGECLVGEGGKEVQMDGELEDELEDLLDMESDAFAHS